MLMKNIKELEQSTFSFRLLHFTSTRIHMHDAYEIVFVLRGSLNLKCTAFDYQLSEGDIFIINVKELHKFSNGSDDNLVLLFHFDPYMYLHIFPKLDFYLFVCDSYASKRKDDENLQMFQTLLLHFFLATHDENKSGNKLNDQMVSIITFLINNYQSFCLGSKGYLKNKLLGSNNYQMQRISEIQEYIYVYSKNKISLESLADYLHLNKFYVSHLIKNGIGLSMTDFISLTRVEQSEAALLSTDLSIEQISFEFGFSARRYYEKHFTRWYGISPSEYRRRNATEQTEEYKHFDDSYLKSSAFKRATDKYIHRFCSQRHVQSFLNYKFSLSSPTAAFNAVKKNTITLSDPYNCLTYVPPQLLLDIKHNLKVKSINIVNIFSSAAADAFSCDKLNNLFHIILDANLDIIININLLRSHLKLINHDIEIFFKRLKSLFGNDDLSHFSVEISGDSRSAVPIKVNDTKYAAIAAMIKNIIGNIQVHPAIHSSEPNYYSHNTTLQIPYILNTCLMDQFNKVFKYRELYDCTDLSKKASSKLYPNNCIFTRQLEKKPLYYVWNFLSELGDELIMKDPGIIVTKKSTSYMVLLYDPNSKLSSKERTEAINFNLEISDVNSSFIATEHYLNSETCLFNQRSLLLHPENLPRETVNHINQATAPTISFKKILGNRSTTMLKYQLNPYSALLIRLDMSE